MADVENATEPADLASSKEPAVQEVPKDAAETEDGGENKDAEAVEAAEDDKDPNCYLNREEYSSERFKLEIRNLPKSFGFGQLRKLLTQLKLKFVKLKAPGNSQYAFVTFVDEAAREEALKVLNTSKYKGRPLEAVYAKPTADPVTSKRKQDDGKNAPVTAPKQPKISPDDHLTPEEKVQKATTPLYNQPYEKQIEIKSNHTKQLLRKLLYKIEAVNSDIFFWTQTQRTNNEGMACALVETVPSPVQDNYRNKCEFTIGYDASETKIVTGFRLGEYKAGSNEVVEPFCCRHIPNQMKAFLINFQRYLNQCEYKPFNVRSHEGNYRQVTVRSNEENELLVIVIFDKQDLTEEQIEKEKNALREYFSNDQNNQSAKEEYGNYKLKSLLFNLNTNRTGISKMDNLDKLVGNEDCLYEKLFDLKFRVSPLAFFQANTKGAEVLYKKIGDLCDIDKDTVVLDICCGTGTIGLTLAHRAKLIVGVEIIQDAIDDAKLNSNLNEIKNVEYHCGKAEEVLPVLLKRFCKERVIAIVDPPRAGLHSKVIQALRRLENLENLIYVSCNPDLAMGNFVDLARATSKNYQSNPFVPIKAIAVDMFPHTSHCELILFFKRYSNELLKK